MHKSFQYLSDKIKGYQVQPSATTEELLTLGQIFAQVGDYTSSILDKEHLETSNICASGLKKVINTLHCRGEIITEEDFYQIPSETIKTQEFKNMSIDELYNLYTQWPLRYKQSENSNLFSYEDQIISELNKRCPSTAGEQLKVDYCTVTYITLQENQTFSKQPHRQ